MAHLYAETLKFALDAVEALNQFEKTHPEVSLTPYIASGIPIVFEDEVIGYLRDEIGGVWCFDVLESFVPYSPG